MRRALAATALAALVLAGCSSPTDVTGSAGESTDPSAVSQRPVPVTGIPSQVQASLPPCPASQDLPALPGGLPAIALACLGPGDPVLLSGLRGKPLIINAWASWCQPCRSELPALASFSAQAGSEVEVLGLNVADDPAAAADLWTQLQIPFPSVTDPDAASRADLAWVGLPVTYFVDADGVIVSRHPGAITDVGEWQALAAEHLGIS